MEENEENLDSEEDGNAAFEKVYDKQEALQDLLDTGGEKDEDATVSLANIKTAGQNLLDAINDLSLADFGEEFAEDEAASEADTLERIFS